MAKTSAGLTFLDAAEKANVSPAFLDAARERALAQRAEFQRQAEEEEQERLRAQPVPTAMESFAHGWDTAPTWDTHVPVPNVASPSSRPAESPSVDDSEPEQAVSVSSTSVRSEDAVGQQLDAKQKQESEAMRKQECEAKRQEEARRQEEAEAKRKEEVEQFLEEMRSGIELSVVNCQEADTGYACVRAAGPRGIAIPKSVNAVYRSVRATCDGRVWTSSVGTHGPYTGHKTLPELMPLTTKLGCAAPEARAEITFSTSEQGSAAGLSRIDGVSPASPACTIRASCRPAVHRRSPSTTTIAVADSPGASHSRAGSLVGRSLAAPSCIRLPEPRDGHSHGRHCLRGRNRAERTGRVPEGTGALVMARPEATGGPPSDRPCSARSNGRARESQRWRDRAIARSGGTPHPVHSACANGAAEARFLSLEELAGLCMSSMRRRRPGSHRSGVSVPSPPSARTTATGPAPNCR